MVIDGEWWYAGLLMGESWCAKSDFLDASDRLDGEPMG